MNDIPRQKAPLTGTELEILNGFLDYHRATLLQKVSGVSDEDMRRIPIATIGKGSASSITLLGLVKHLAYAELRWFQMVLKGLDVSDPSTETDPDADWRIEPEDTTTSIMSLFQAEVAKSRQIVQESVNEAGGEDQALEIRAKNPDYKNYSLRWIMLHMLEELARHNGHADILREAIDGVTGV